MKYVLMTSFALFLTTVAQPAAAQNFTGPSVGGQVGWSDNQLRGPAQNGAALPVHASQDSPTLGVYAGYDREFGRIVVGGELGVSFGTDDAINAANGIARYRIDPRRSFDVSARAGYLITPKTLVYARGGYVNEQVRTTLTPPAGSVSRSDDRNGWLAGGGLERVLLPHLSVRAEYRYVDLSDGFGKWDRHQVLTGITWRF